MLKLKGIVSTFLIISFIIAAITGIVLFFGAKGSTLKNVHDISGLIMILLVLIHFFLKRKIYAAELKTWKKKIKT